MEGARPRPEILAEPRLGRKRKGWGAHRKTVQELAAPHSVLRRFLRSATTSTARFRRSWRSFLPAAAFLGYSLMVSTFVSRTVATKTD